MEKQLNPAERPPFDTTLCKGCMYWYSSYYNKYCNYMFKTGHSRARENGVCLSRTPRKGKDTAVLPGISGSSNE